jgi:hypothetical protein
MKISRLELIQILSRRYFSLMRQRRLKAAAMIHVRLKELLHKQLRHENRC